MSFDATLKLLSDGRAFSRAQLEDQLGISSDELKLDLEQIEALGLPLSVSHNDGYSIEGGVDLLAEQSIRSGLSASVTELISEIDILSVTDSTNVQAMKEAQKGNSGYICTAEQQTAGRGRRGRSWASPYASNIYLSVTWTFAGGASSLEGLSLAVGVAVVTALEKASVEGVQLKWPNDVLYRHRKLAGILVEISGNLSGPCQVVVGIGLNVKMPRAAASEIDQPWIDVSTIIKAPIERSHILALLLNELMPMLEQYNSHGFSYYKDRWQQLDAYAGKDVKILLGQEQIIGSACGVDDSGAIRVKTESGIRVFNGGEVSLRSGS